MSCWSQKVHTRLMEPLLLRLTFPLIDTVYRKACSEHKYLFDYDLPKYVWNTNHLSNTRADICNDWHILHDGYIITDLVTFQSTLTCKWPTDCMILQLGKKVIWYHNKFLRSVINIKVNYFFSDLTDVYRSVVCMNKIDLLLLLESFCCCTWL